MSFENNIQKAPSFKESIIVLLVSVVSLMLIQFSFEHLYATGKMQIAFIIAGLMLLMLVVGISRIAWRNIDSPYFAVSNLLAIALGTVIGTFVLQTLTPENFQIHYGEKASAILRFGQFDDVFTSWWYVALYVLLALSLLKMSSHRKLSKANLGFHLAHLSPIIVLVGFWIDHFNSYRGIIKLEVGQQANEVLLDSKHNTNTNKIKELDFFIRLDNFEFEKFEPDYKVQIWKKPGENNPHEEQSLKPSGKPKLVTSYDLKPDKIRHIYGTDLYFRLLNFYPNFHFDYQYPTDVDTITAIDPGVLLDIKTTFGEAVLQLKTKPEGRHILTDPSMDCQLEYYWELPQELQQKSENPSLIKQKRIVILGASNQVYFVEENAIRVEELDFDKWYDVPAKDSVQFKVKLLYLDGSFLRSVPATKNDTLENPVAQMEVWGRNWPKSELVYLYPNKAGKGGLYDFKNEDYLLALESTKSRETKYWKSDLTALNVKGDSIWSQSIIVNEPMYLKGHRFYQTDYDPQNPNYSGIGVSYEPGLKIIYLGFFLLVLGSILMLFKRKNDDLHSLI